MGASDAGFASFRPSLQHPSTAFGNATLARHDVSGSVASASNLPGQFVNRRGKHETGPQGGPPSAERQWPAALLANSAALVTSLVQ